MKKYLVMFLSLSFMLIVTSAVNAGPSENCVAKLNDVANAFEKGKTFEDLLKEGKWEQFKTFARSVEKWDGIVQVCCPACVSSSPPECTTDPNFQCDLNDDRTWRCLCCWGDTRCYAPPR